MLRLYRLGTYSSTPILRKHLFFKLSNSNRVSWNVPKLLALFMHDSIQAYHLEDGIYSQPIHLLH